MACLIFIFSTINSTNKQKVLFLTSMTLSYSGSLLTSQSNSLLYEISSPCLFWTTHSLHLHYTHCSQWTTILNLTYRLYVDYPYISILRPSLSPSLSHDPTAQLLYPYLYPWQGLYHLYSMGHSNSTCPKMISPPSPTQARCYGNMYV